MRMLFTEQHAQILLLFNAHMKQLVPAEGLQTQLIALCTCCNISLDLPGFIIHSCAYQIVLPALATLLAPSKGPTWQAERGCLI